jgi:hypothetical protein
VNEKLVQDHVSRIRKSYQERLERDQFLSRGEANTSEDRPPVLYVDVNFGQPQAERLVVYQGQSAE